MALCVFQHHHTTGISTFSPAETFSTPIPPRNLIVIVTTTDTQAVTYTDNNTITVVIYTVSLIGHINPTGYYDYIRATT